ncbi:MAG: type IV pilus secretin PilQ [Vicinamibacterales bacterium]
MYGRVPRFVLASALAAALAVTVTAAGRAVPEIVAVSARADARLSTVLIEATEPVAYVTSQPDPLTVLVDLRNVQASLEGATGAAASPVAGVSLEAATAADGAPLTRVRIQLDRAASHHVRSSRNRIFVEVDRNSAAAPETRPAPAAAAADAPAGGAATSTPVVPPPVLLPAQVANRLESVSVQRSGDVTAVTLRGNGRLVPSTVERARDMPPRVLLDFEGVAAGNAASLIPVDGPNILRVRVAVNSRSPLVTRVVVDLARVLEYRVEEIDDGLRVIFGEDETAAADPPAVAAAATPPASPAGAPVPDVAEAPAPPVAVPPAPAPAAPVPAPASPEIITPPAGAGTAASVPAAQSVPSAPSVSSAPSVAPPAAGPAASAPAMAATTATPPASAPPPAAPPVAVVAAQAAQGPASPRFTGSPVTLDFQGADLRAVLRTFAEISGLNIVIDPTIDGTVDVSLREVPWDQALDIILKANKLGYTVDGTIVRIAPLSVLAQEEEERRRLSEAQALAGQLEVLTRPLSYARAQELVQIVTRSALSERGEVQVDSRTNTLIIRDLPARLRAAESIIATLDSPQPQVEIEARIVRVRREHARELGILWGVNGRVSPELGNTTGLAFPNSGSLQGRTGGTQGPDNANTAVNLGTENQPTGAIGLSLGSVNGSFNLDVALQALEGQGKLRLLSAPRVSTQNNLEAEIYQGTQIPIQTVANNTVTVTFKDAALTLRVTPQITASDTVIMRIVLEKAQADFSRSVNGIPPIDTQRANTNVLLADGETTVIGGIFESQEISGQSSVPFLSRIPLLGWLFKNSVENEFQDELMIFITPRIIKG